MPHSLLTLRGARVLCHEGFFVICTAFHHLVRVIPLPNPLAHPSK